MVSPFIERYWAKETAEVSASAVILEFPCLPVQEARIAITLIIKQLRIDYLTCRQASAMELSLVSILSALDERTQGALAPATNAAVLTPGTNCVLDL